MLRTAAAAIILAACAGPAPAPSPSPLTAPVSAAPAPPSRKATAQPAKKAKPTGKAKAKPAAKAKPVARSKSDSLRLEHTLIAQQSHAPLAQVLARRSGNAAVADRVAAAVVREAQRRRLSPSFVAGVLLVENAGMDTTARSHAGAIGLMQVMPFHAGGWGCDSAELTELDANVCHGVGVLQMYVRRNDDVTTALRRYNGCTGCRRYPARVLRTASSIRREMLVQASSPRQPAKRPSAPKPKPKAPPVERAIRSGF